jgi:hypothetical protein
MTFTPEQEAIIKDLRLVQAQWNDDIALFFRRFSEKAESDELSIFSYDATHAAGLAGIYEVKFSLDDALSRIDEGDENALNVLRKLVLINMSHVRIDPNSGSAIYRVAAYSRLLAVFTKQELSLL